MFKSFCACKVCATPCHVIGKACVRACMCDGRVLTTTQTEYNYGMGWGSIVEPTLEDLGASPA